MKKICFFLSDINGTGGISRVTWIIANHLANKYDISVLACSNNSKVRYIYNSKVKVGYLFEELKPAHSRFFEIVHELKRYLKDNHIDTFICAGVLLYPMCSLAIRGTNIRYICWEHSNASVENEFRFQKWCRLIGAKTCDEVITLTKADAEMYKQKYHVKKCKNIYNPVDERLVSDITYDTDSKMIISVGRLCYQKNFEQLVDVAKIVLDKRPDWLWHIYGEGENRTAIEAKIRENRLENQLLLMGNVPDLYTRYKNYSFLVMTSRFEGFPMTLLESTACGVPSISFDILTGPNEIILQKQTGYLTEKDNVEDMATRIIELIDNPTLRKSMSDNCGTRRKSFECDTIVEQWCRTLG